MPAANSGLKEARIRRFIGKPSNGGEPNVDRRWGEIPLVGEEAVPRYHVPVEREARLRTVPPDKLINGVSI
jgi:hypothetical protein